jgi:hypothetical protein
MKLIKNVRKASTIPQNKVNISLQYRVYKGRYCSWGKIVVCPEC